MMDNIRKVLEFLASLERDKIGKAWKTASEIKETLNMSFFDVNDAVQLAENRGWVECKLAKSVAPYAFGEVMITPEGRLWLDDV